MDPSWNGPNQPPGDPYADLDYDGECDLSDGAIFGANFTAALCGPGETAGAGSRGAPFCCAAVMLTVFRGARVMTNRNVAIGVLLTITMLLPKPSYCDIYEFTGGASKNVFTLKAFIDGDEVLVDGAVGNNQSMHGFRWESTDSCLRMDVDVVGLKALFTEVHSIQSGVVSGTGVIKQGGFGGLEIPFTIYMSDSYFHSSKSRGWYEIDPFNLDFNLDELAYDQGDGVMNFTGYVDMIEQDFNFDVTTSAETFHGHCTVSLDDSGYPDTLNLSISGPNLDWYTYGSTKLVETSVEGHLVELYAHYTGTGLAGTNWDGEYIPEPTTLLLLGLGALVLGSKCRGE